MRQYKPKKCGCGKPMTPYVENLAGNEWLESCETCSTYRLISWTTNRKITPAAAAKIEAKWNKQNGVK